MAQEATIKVNLEQGNSKQTLADLKKEVDAVDSSVDNLNNDFVEGQKQAEKTTVSLKTQLRQLKDEMVTLDDNSPRFKEMAIEASAMEDKIKDVDAKVRLLASDTKRLDGLVGAGTAIAGAFQASQGAMALMGVESEKVQKSIQNIIAVQGIMNGVTATANALNKDAVAGMFLRSAVTKIVTAGQWLLNIAMNANPIGLIILGIGALIGAYFLLRDTLSDTKKDFNTLTKVMLVLLGPLGLIILAYKELTKEVEDFEGVREQQSKNEGVRHRKQLKEIDKLRAKEAQAHKDKLTAIDLEIARLEAEGKSSFDLKIQRLNDILDEEKAILDSNNKKIQSWIEHYTNLAKIQGQNEEEFKASLLRQGLDLDALHQRALDNQEEQKQAIFQAETEIIALQREHREANKTESKKATDDNIKQKQNEQKELERLEKQRLKEQQLARDREQKMFNDFLLAKETLENEFFDKQLTAQQLEENAIADKYFNLLEQARQFGEDTKILEEAQALELLELRERLSQEAQEARIQANQELADITIDNAQEVLKIVGTLQELGNRKEIDRIKAKDKAGEKLSKAEKKRLINDEKQKRAIAVAEIAIDTARAIAKAVASGAGIGFPQNIPAIIAGVGAVLANVASATKLINAPLPSFDTGGSGGGDISGSLGGNASENAPSINANQSGSTILNEPPTQVVVLESDITGAQTNVKTIEQQATI